MFKEKKVQLTSKELDSGVYPVMKMIQISSLFFLPAATISNELAYFLWTKSRGTYWLLLSLAGSFLCCSLVCFSLKLKLVYHVCSCHLSHCQAQCSVGAIFEPTGDRFFNLKPTFKKNQKLEAKFIFAKYPWPLTRLHVSLWCAEPTLSGSQVFFSLVKWRK